MSNKVLKVKDIINSTLANDDEKGKVVYNNIKGLFFEEYDFIILDFEGITLINTAFLNDAIGILFRDLELMQITSKLRVRNIDNEDMEMFKEVLKNAAEKFFKIKYNKNNRC